MIALPIVTRRLEIRPFTPADARAMLDVYGDPDVMRYIPGGPLAGLDAVRAVLDEHAEAHARDDYAFWALVERSTGRILGDVGFGVFAPTGDTELGYTLARNAWGRGYATEAAGACLGAALADRPGRRVIAVADAENLASHRVAERIGMHRGGPITAHGRPHELFIADGRP